VIIAVENEEARKNKTYGRDEAPGQRHTQQMGKRESNHPPE